MDIEKQKNKAKNVPDRLPVLKFFLYGFLVVAIIIIILILLGPVISKDIYRIKQTSLPDELYSVAEMLPVTRNVSESTQVVNEVSIYLVFDPLENGGLAFADDFTLCVYGDPVDEHLKYHRQSQLLVNGQEVWRAFQNYGVYTSDGSNLRRLTWCATGDLEPGLHLIEFHLRDSFLGAPLAIQQWAIEVE